MKKFLIYSLLFFSKTVSMANYQKVTFRCTASSSLDCEKKIIQELNSLNCKPLTQTLRCSSSNSPHDPHFFCFLATQNCLDTISDGYGEILCQKGETVNIRDKNLTATWARTFFEVWVRALCRI